MLFFLGCAALQSPPPMKIIFPLMSECFRHRLLSSVSSSLSFVCLHPPLSKSPRCFCSSNSPPLLDTASSILLIRALSESKKLTRAKAVLSGLKRRGAVPDCFLFSLVLHCLVPEGSIHDVESVWSDSVGRCSAENASSFILRVCRHGSAASEIEQVYRRISTSRWRMSREHYMAFLGAFCERKNPNPILARNILREMEEKGFEADELTYFSVFRSFCRTGNLYQADLILRSMVQRWDCEVDMLIYGNFLDGLFKSAKYREARKLFDKMTKRKHNASQNSSMPSLKSGRRVIFQLKMSRLVSEEAALGTYFRSLCRVGRVEEAERLQEEAKQRSIVLETCAYRSLLEALFQVGRAEDAIGLLESERKKGNSSVGDISVPVVLGLCKLGRVDDGYRLLLGMVNDGFVPTAQVWNRIIKSYWNEGRVDEALAIFEGMRAQTLGGYARPDVSTYSLMINAFLEKGDTDTALLLAQELATKKFPAEISLHQAIFHRLFTQGKLEESQSYLNKLIEKGILVSYAESKYFFDIILTERGDDFQLDKSTHSRHLGIRELEHGNPTYG